MFWRSFNLTFKANLFDELLMQPQKKLLFGFLFRALSGKLGYFGALWSIPIFRGSQRQQFISSTRILLPTPKIGLFWNFFSLTSSSKNRSRFSQRTKVVLQRTEKLFFRTTAELTILTATLQCVLQPS